MQNSIDIVGSEFNIKIKERFPEHSKSEIELISLIKLKLSYKQIAVHKNTSQNTNNAAFQRLRNNSGFESMNEFGSFIEGF